MLLGWSGLMMYGLAGCAAIVPQDGDSSCRTAYATAMPDATSSPSVLETGIATVRNPASTDIPPVALEFLPPPPAEGSPDFERDKAVYLATRAERGTARWEQAAFDAADSENFGDLFTDAFGLRLTPETTPETLALVRMANSYARQSIQSAKDHYQRVRPYVYFNEPSGSTCAPGDEDDLRDNGAYPSGHTVRGWMMALVLSGISPERQSAVLRRGLEIGQSRVICGVHWQSDVEAARTAVTAAFVQLQNQPEFRSRMERVKREIARLRGEPTLPTDFVLVTDVVPDVLLDIRYYNPYNFVGARIDGYEAPVAWLTRPAAEGLRKAAEKAGEQGYIFRIFDAYRPQRAVDHFVRWAADPDAVANRDVFYPEVDKADLFEKGYIALKSGHSRGSTIDLTLVERATGRELDMGTPFDYFGPRSHHGAAGLTEAQTANRAALATIMSVGGFRPYLEEWWHYTLEDEPYPDTYFDFPVR
jgi:D-alanyl-D-alanine dipeptidase